MQISVGPQPVDLADALGIGAFGLWIASTSCEAQNRGPATIYRAVSPTVPDLSAVSGWRHPSGDVWTMTMRTAGVGGAQWVWTVGGSATLILEAGGLP